MEERIIGIEITSAIKILAPGAVDNLPAAA